MIVVQVAYSSCIANKPGSQSMLTTAVYICVHHIGSVLSSWKSYLAAERHQRSAAHDNNKFNIDVSGLLAITPLPGNGLSYGTGNPIHGTEARTGLSS